MATTLAAGWPARISLARFGPVSTATGCPGSTSSTTSLMRLRVSRSRPLARLTTGTHGRTKPAAACQHLAEVLRRHRHHHHVGLRRHLLEVGRGLQALGQVVRLEVGAVAVLVVDLLGQLRLAGPEHGRGVLGRQGGDRGAPGPGTDRPPPGSPWRHRRLARMGVCRPRPGEGLPPGQGAPGRALAPAAARRAGPPHGHEGAGRGARAPGVRGVRRRRGGRLRDRARGARCCGARASASTAR